MTIYSILTSILPIIIFTFAQNAVYAKKEDRAKLALLVPLAVIYAIAGVFAVWKYHITIERFLNGYGLVTYSSIAANMLLMAGFIVIKVIAGGILLRIRNSKSLVSFTSSRFYTYAEEYDTWFLQYRWSNYRTFQNVIRWGMVIGAGFFLSFINSRRGDTLVTLTFPTSVVIIFNELYHFFNGETKEEFEHSIMGAQADSRRMGYFFRIREILEHVLPGPLLSAMTGFELAGKTTPADLVNRLSKSEDKADRITGDYYLADNRYMQAEADGVQATLDLMHRRNVVFHNPFYRDLAMYVTLPLVHALVSGKKAAVVTGRMSAKEDVRQWLDEVLSEYTHMPSLWHVEDIAAHRTNCEIGVLSFPELYDRNVLINNEEFFEDTEFVMLIEPSAILSTGQVALSILAQEMEKGEKKPVYFVCDRVVDGLVDTVSHLLRAEFTEVVAPPVPRCIYTGMTWDANGDYCRQQLFDKQTRYLGNGIELASIAVKNQIPKALWYGETKVPIRDIKWLAGQNYPVICQYINQPSQQSTIYDKIEFIANLWSAPKQKEQFAIVEDEFDNMFATMRTYLSRGTSQSFVNVISENYLLRDYMRYNQQICLANPDAIPSIVPDYAKTERNTLIKLILLMARRPVTEQEIIDEFHLVGCDSDSAYALLSRYLAKYTNARIEMLDSDTIEVEADELTTQAVNVYTITPDNFKKYFGKTLAEAFYIVEEESGNTDFVDARFFSHVTQCILPGQFVTYDGKYYRVKHISPQTGVVLRRASDLFNDRRYYRQIREYTLETHGESLLSSRRVAGMDFNFIERDIHVRTTGYLDMGDVNDLKTAKKIDLSGDPLVENYSRDYRCKTILQITLPDTDDETRFTFCLLLSELCRSVFPDAWPFLAITMGTHTEYDPEDLLTHMIYPVKGSTQDGDIYIIEDSDIDLGILGAIERNWDRLMEILGDFLSWHFSKMLEPVPVVRVQPKFDAGSASDGSDIPEEAAAKAAKAASGTVNAKKKGLIGRFIQRLRDLFPEVEAERQRKKGAKPAKPVAAAETGPAPDPAVTEAGTEAAPEPATEAAPAASPEAAPEAAPVEPAAAEEPAAPEAAAAEPEAAPAETPAEEAAPAEETPVEAKTESQEPSDNIAAEADKEPATSAEPEAEAGAMPEAEPAPETEEDEAAAVAAELEPVDTRSDAEKAVEAAAAGTLPDSRYNRVNFLKFGGDTVDERLRLIDVFNYMDKHGWTDNSLTKARTRDSFLRTALDVKAVNHCDFCGRGLSGASYELLNDGRVRCNDCSASAITSVEELREIFFQAIELMEAFYGIKYRVPVKVRMADARTVAKGAGRIFRPSTEYASRVLGFAQKVRGRKNRGTYALLVENGAPRLAALETMVHEMTHIWQYINWPDGAIDAAYNMGDPALTRFANLVVYEGMAVWSAIQYLYQIGETHYAAEIERMNEARQDPYGLGFRIFRDQYPLVKDASLIIITPFASFPPVDPQKVKEEIIKFLLSEQ